MNNKNNHIVVSAVNLVEGGTLTILNDFLEELCKHKKINNKNFTITAIVHNKELIKTKNIKIIEKKKIKRSWFKRLYFEYIESYFLSKKIKADIWIAMHDMTPNVSCNTQIVYCHNPMCFYKMHASDFFQYPKEYLFSKFYKYLYGINIKKNKYVITQQIWIKEAFNDFFKINNVIVARPFKASNQENKYAIEKKIIKNSQKIYFYPALPRFFKNHETLLLAWNYLYNKYNDFNAKLILTLDGTENNYSKKIFSKFKNTVNVDFVGRLTIEEVNSIYGVASCLVFPSNLETWGLPLSEAQKYSLDIIASDLPYARESVGDYEKAAFFPKNDFEALAILIYKSYTDSLNYEKNSEHKISQSHLFEDWNDLLNEIIK